MKGLPFHNRPRSIGAQIDRMRHRWPGFRLVQRWDTGVVWVGELRPFQKPYMVKVRWDPVERDRPYVSLLDPPLSPRSGGTFEEIPHLMFDENDPAQSGLCLFNPDGAEWAANMLIADTTLPWAAEWLFYYELWHYEGVWRGGGVGPESIAQTRAEAIHGEAKEHAPDAQGETAVANGETVQDTIA